MPVLVLQPVDLAAATALAQQLACWAKTDRGVTDPRVQYTGCCASPTAETVGRWTVDTAVCGQYGPPPFTGNGGQAIDCGTEVAFGTYLIYPGDVAPIDPNQCASPGPPGPIVLGWEPDAAVMTAVEVMTAGPDGMPVLIDFGDGSPLVRTMTGRPVVHDYSTPGARTVTAWPVEAPQMTASVDVVVKDHAPVLHAYADPDDEWRALLWVDEPANGTTYAIDWGDGSDPEPILRDPPPYPRVPHDYTATGTYTVTVTDLSTKRTSTVDYDVAEMGMLFTFPADDATPTLRVVRMRVGATWTVDWGDGTAPDTGTVPVHAQLVASHDIAMAPGDYTVTVTETVDGQPRRTASRVLTIPSVFNLNMNVGLVWTRTNRQLQVTPYETPASETVTIDWGDGSPTEQVGGGQAATHVYASAPPAEGWMLRVTEDAGQLRRYTRLLGEPVYVGVPRGSAWARWSAELVVQGIAGDTNADWYAIWWGDGTLSEFGAVGADWTAWHQYSQSGEYTITVDSPGMDEPVTRQLIVPDYPVPLISVAEDTADPNRMSILATVDNSACGGEVQIDFDDGATVTAGPDETISHTYASAGTYAVRVICAADTTARGRAYATVPWGEVTSLAAEIGPHPDGNPYRAQITVTAYDHGRTVVADWADGTPAAAFEPPLTDHTYDFDDDYVAEVRYSNGSESVSLPVTIPFGG